MILIADSGATKTDWCLISPLATLPPQRIKTQGINPFHQSEDQIIDILRNELLPQLSALNCERPMRSIHFYGAGCTAEMKRHVEAALRKVFATFPTQPSAINVESDLLGAARAVCMHQRGLVGILGTGANSCLYDGKDILENIPPLGYILGDEGSGATFGKILLNQLFKNPNYTRLQEQFLAYEHCTQSDIIERVYRQPLANRYLASLVKFAKENVANPLIEQLVVQNFDAFITHNLLHYNTSLRDVYVVGGMAAAFPEQLEQACQQRGYTLRHILRSPIEGLIEYHKNNATQR